MPRDQLYPQDRVGALVRMHKRHLLLLLRVLPPELFVVDRRLLDREEIASLRADRGICLLRV